MKKVELYNTAPNGMKIDMVTLTEVPYPDNSGVEYLIEFQGLDILDKFKVGRFDLILGEIRFTDYDKSEANGITHTGLKLLVNWIEENIQD